MDHDPDYTYGFKHYKDVTVFSSGYPYGEKMLTALGRIISVNDYEFEHDIATEKGSSGSPIILLSNQKVIGVHKQANRNYNQGTFIGAIIDKLQNTSFTNDISGEENKIKNMNIKNSFSEKSDKLKHSFDSTGEDDSLYSQNELRKELITDVLSIDEKMTLYTSATEGNLDEFKKLISKRYPY